jgi:GTP cyclohydrolase IA
VASELEQGMLDNIKENDPYYHAHRLLSLTSDSYREKFRNEDQHIARTPQRFAKMLHELTTPEHFEFTVFDNDGCDEMVTVGPIPFTALCSHHIIPFMGNAWVAYIPNQCIVGLSKIPRAVINISKGLWAQEQLTAAIADYLEKQLEPVGVAVVMKAEHLCMTIRGVQVPGALTTTSAMRGAFGEHDKLARAEFLEFIR